MIVVTADANVARLDGLIGRFSGMIRAVLWDGLRDAVSIARALAPVRTGDLRDSIDVEERGRSIALIATMPYAGYVEYGTRFMAARPYLTPAVNAVEWVAIAREHLAGNV